MNVRFGRRAGALGLLLLLCPGRPRAHPAGPAAAPPDTAAHAHGMAPAHAHDAASHGDLHGMQGTHDMHGTHGMHGMHDMQDMPGMYGPYAGTREASGTSWQPDAARHQGVHVMRGPWTLMFHGFADLVYDDQGGDRGATKLFADDMFMTMARRPAGPGTLGLRSMLSLEPATIGRQGYPLLLQTGETADGRTPLVDRQHPHDLFMELAASYSVASGDRSLFVYGGLPGEPALGPPAFMHRYSGMNIPVAPITHHWLDSSHITFGVLTVGAVADRVKLEASAFRGREPDQDRWNIETPKLDSHAFRLSVNPTDHWALQLSHGRLKRPEQLEPDVDQDRTTASAAYEGSRGGSGHWGALLAWGRDRNRPGRVLDALTAEAAAGLDERHTVFARIERVEKDELFVAPDARAGRVFAVGQLTAGWRGDLWSREHVLAGLGVAGTLSHVPRELRGAYGDTPLSLLVFLHGALR